MEYLWIPITLWAATMQITRTALQKNLKKQISDMAVVSVRYIYALPFVLLYVAGFLWWGHGWPSFNSLFLFYVVIGSLTQIVATAMLIKLFSYRNFAVSTMFSKTDALQAAVFGFALFGHHFSYLGLVALGVGLAGLLLTLMGKEGLAKNDLIGALREKSAWLGICAGALFAVTALCIREAVAALPDAHPFFAAALMLMGMIVLQSLLLLAYLARYEYRQFAAIYRVNGSSLLVGITSLLGSIGWYTAFALMHPAYVKTLAQIELPMAIAVSALFFGEKINKLELWGMLFIALAVILVAFV